MGFLAYEFILHMITDYKFDTEILKWIILIEDLKITI
jgi:hypothetical protein